jgi:hypothetical protein
MMIQFAPTLWACLSSPEPFGINPKFRAIMLSTQKNRDDELIIGVYRSRALRNLKSCTGIVPWIHHQAACEIPVHPEANPRIETRAN